MNDQQLQAFIKYAVYKMEAPPGQDPSPYMCI
jgi:hypothetical protein